MYETATRVCKFLSICCAIIFLAGCAYLDSSEDAAPGAEKEMAGLSARYEGAPPPPLLEEEPRGDIVFTEQGQAAASEDLMDIANKVSGGRVDIFPLDGPVRSSEKIMTPGDGMRAPVATRRFAQDSSVEIFPLDADMAAALPLHLTEVGREKGLLPLAMEKEPGKRPLEVVESENADFVTLHRPGQSPLRVYFDHDSTTPDRKAVESLVQAIKGSLPPDYLLSIEGHASRRAAAKDPAQRQIINLRVSMERAFVIARRLIEMGIPGENIRTIGWGQGQAVPDISGMTGEAAARRVDVVPLSQ